MFILDFVKNGKFHWRDVGTTESALGQNSYFFKSIENF